jgi:Sec-independent protein translocase protein TatA
VFGVGPYEMLIILLVGLMLFSPRELPGVLRSISRFWASIRRTADEFRDAILQDEELRAPLDELRGVVTDTRQGLRDVERRAREEVQRARVELREAEQRLAHAARSAAPTALDRRVELQGPEEVEATEPVAAPRDELSAPPDQPAAPPAGAAATPRDRGAA